MEASLIDGKAVAASLRVRIADAVAGLAQRHGIVPGLAVVMVGDDPASQIYVRSKCRQTQEAAMRSIEHRLPAGTSEVELLALIRRLNADPGIDGILVQLPLPPQIDTGQVIAAIDPAKDVDGFHPVNAGGLVTGGPGLVPCTPLGCLMLIRTVRQRLTGLDAVVIGCSNIVGKPMAHLLLRQGCTITVVHAHSRDVAAACRRADILVAAAGRAGLVRGDWVKPGATVVDVGINRTEAGQLVGDVVFEEAARVAGAITPVPGGVGPMTIACLLANTLKAAAGRRGLADYDIHSLGD